MIFFVTTDYIRENHSQMEGHLQSLLVWREMKGNNKENNFQGHGSWEVITDFTKCLLKQSNQ